MTTVPLYVLVGPSGVGKGTVLKQLVARYPQLQLSISATTRPSRPGEVDGRDYFFISDEQFDRLIAEDRLLEWAVVHKKYRYGTPADWVRERQDEGRVVLLEVDLDGARQVMRRLPDTHGIFLAPPSWKELEKRLLGRATEDAAEQSRRLQTAKAEMAAVGEFETVIVNVDVNSTVQELAQTLGLN
ncbi:guanylate kinase [Actinomycetaceae bacterium MB13-C1-2]|nr:guanylate kinase [Actinomycetaceae bacterium MB13-C1-2]